MSRFFASLSTLSQPMAWFWGRGYEFVKPMAGMGSALETCLRTIVVFVIPIVEMARFGGIVSQAPHP